MPEADPTEPADPGAPGRPPAPLTFRQRVEMLTGAELRPPAGVVAAVVGVAVIAALLLARAGSPPPPELTIPVVGGPGDVGATTTTVAQAVLVHAAGAVVTPGVYELAAGARVADVVDAAGGPAPGADLDRLNLAAPLEDGQQVYVPRVGEPVPTGAAGAGGGGERSGPLDLNTATVAELDHLPGIGPALADAILRERERRGGFGSVEELLEVRGIGPAKLDQIRDLVTV